MILFAELEKRMGEKKKDGFARKARKKHGGKGTREIKRLQFQL